MSERMGDAGGFRKGVAKAYSGAALDMAGDWRKMDDPGAAPEGLEH
jgi:hypothetical protein